MASLWKYNQRRSTPNLHWFKILAETSDHLGASTWGTDLKSTEKKDVNIWRETEADSAQMLNTLSLITRY